MCFILDSNSPTIYTPIDDKPKRDDDPLALARVRDIAEEPRVTVLVDRWDEDWTQLAWLRVEGRATILGPDAANAEFQSAVATLRAKYPQYATHDLERRPLIRISLERAVVWGPPDGPGPMVGMTS
jgi:PPOX class probable F420-dependent enzyme